MSQYSLSCYITSFATFFIAIIVFFYNKKSKINIIFLLYSLSISEWSFLTASYALTSSQELSLLCARTMHIGVSFIPVLFFHFCLVLLNLYEQNKNKLFIGYSLCAVLIILSLTTSTLVLRVRPKLGYNYFMDAGVLYPALIGYFTVYVILGMRLLLREYLISVGNRRNQLKYLLLGSFVGYILGSSNFLPVYDISVFPYPFGSYAITFYVGLTAYAIMKYRLMDIRVAVASTGVFVAVYAVTLGMPFYFYNKGHQFFSLVLMGILATLGPSIYLFFQRRVNDALLAEQRRNHHILFQASSRMGRVKDLGMLLKLIIRIIVRTIKVEHCAVYTLDNSSGAFLLGSSFSRNKNIHPPSSILSGSVLALYLEREKTPVIFEEINQKASSEQNPVAGTLLSELNVLNCAIVIPCIVDRHLIAIIVLGERKENVVFSKDDISVFTILGNQAALAIENALFYQEVKDSQEKLSQAEKMATLGHLAGGLSHQLGNKLTSINVYLQQIEQCQDSLFSGDKVDVAAGLLKKARNSVTATNDFVKNLLNFATNRESKEAVDLEKLVDATLGFKDLKNYAIEVQFEKRFVAGTSGAPKAYANFVQLQEALLNIIDNAVYSMQEKRNLGIDPTYQPKIIFSGLQKGDRVVLTIEDNGMGIKPEDQRKLFKPQFSTKQEAGAGHGFGLYFVREVVENRNGGSVQYFSEYGQGVRVEIALPKYN